MYVIPSVGRQINHVKKSEIEFSQAEKECVFAWVVGEQRGGSGKKGKDV